MELQPQLMIAPSEIVFRGPYNQMTRSSFQLHNPAQKTMAFKLLTTAAAKFQVAPPNGVILPGQTITIQVALQPIVGLDNEFLDGDKFNWRKQKFAVRSAACHHDTTDPLVVINSSPPEKLMEVKVPCRFDQSDSGSSTRVGTDPSLMFQEDGGRGKSGGHNEGDSSFGSDFGASTGSTVFKTVFGIDESSHSSDEDTGAINYGKGNNPKSSSNGTSSKSSNEDEGLANYGKGAIKNGPNSSSNGTSSKSSSQDERPASYGKGAIPNSPNSSSNGSSGKSSNPDERPASNSGKGPSQSTSKRPSGSAATNSSHLDPLLVSQATESDALGNTTLALTSAIAGSGVAGKSKGEPSRSGKASSHKSAHGSGVEKPPPVGGQEGEDPLEQLMAPPVLLFAVGLLLLIVFLNLIL